jgi:chromosome segregation ATPase
MAKVEPKIDDLRERLSDLMAAWQTEISAVVGALEKQQASAATHAEQSRAFERQASELTALRERVHERDLALEQLKKASKEKDLRLAALEKERKQAHARMEDLERKLGAQDKTAQYQKGSQQAEFEAMRTELAARKSLVKSLRADAERGKALEKEFAASREAIASMKESLERHTRTIAELRKNSESWERKYRRLAEAGLKEPSRDDSHSESDMFTETVAEMFLDETMDADGIHTIVIDMTEPLRKARDQLREKTGKG